MLKEARKKKGYTQSFIAEHIGSYLNYVYRLENGKCKIDKKYVKSLEEILEIIIPVELICKKKRKKTKGKGKTIKPKSSKKAFFGKSAIKSGIRNSMGIYGLNSKYGSMLTMGSNNGECVNMWIEMGIKPSNITNVEKDIKILKQYKTHKYGTNDYHGTMLAYLLYEHKGKLDVAFLDFCGSLTEDLASSIKIASLKMNAGGIIGITLNNCERKKDNPIFNTELVNTVKHLLPGYSLVSQQEYRDEGKTAKMKFLIFKKRKKQYNI